MKNRSLILLPFLFLAMMGLLAGLWSGLVRLGWAVPGLTAALPVQHGPLMVSGFLGTLIALERVAALRRRWMFAAPMSSGLGWVTSLALPGSLLGPLLIALGSLVTTAILFVMVRREPRLYTGTMAVGAACWLVGNLFWLAGLPIPRVVGWWAAFLVLTIAGERLELSRVMRLDRRSFRTFAAATGLFLAGVGLATVLPAAGAWVSGAGMLALAAWLLRYDIARRNLSHPAALTRFIAVCLFTGYLWLGAAGLLNLLLGTQIAGPLYDATLHAVFVGFVFSMIFGHAPIILPALTGLPVAFHPRLYLPLTLLHGSLIARVTGDLAGWPAGRMWGGLLNEVAILGFLGLFLYTVLQRPTSFPTKR